MGRMTTICTTMAAAASVMSCQAEPGYEPTEAALRSRPGGRKVPEIQARPCRSDAIFVDVPLNADLVWTNANFVSSMRTALDTLLATRADSWFCAAPGCLTESVRTQIDTVLPARSSENYRGDGHLRFFRVSFVGEATEAPKSLQTGWACEAVSEVRAAMAAATGAPPEAFYVGRECDMAPMSVEAAATQDMLAWHTRALGLPDTVLNVAPAGSETSVDLAIVDSGIDPQVASAIGVASSDSFVGGNSAVHLHGTGMGILARQVAPEADLRSYRMMETGGMGTSAQLAKAIDAALYNHNPADGAYKPLIMNLSLGAPAELTRHAAVSGFRYGGGACSSWEDPYGEPVRYLLDVAARLDRNGDRPIFVSAAAGNRPMDVDPDLFPPAPTFVDTGIPSCTLPNPLVESWFFPGELHREDSCRPTDSGHHRLAFTTSPVNDMNEASKIGLDHVESPLVAPGEHVMTGCPAGAQPACGQGQLGITLPATFSGSSVSSVLTAAAAARLQSHRIDARQAPLDRETIGRVLYLTGVDVCDDQGQRRIAMNGAPVRRLDVARLDHVARECIPVIECAQQASGLEPIDSGLLFSCAAELADCELERLDRNGNLEVACPDAGTRLVPPAGYVPPNAYQRAGTPTILSDAQCHLQSCADKAGVHRNLVGSLGPQPAGDGCPWCFMSFQSDGMARAVLELTDELPSGTVFSDPWLIVTGINEWNQQKETLYVNLSSVTDPTAWAPGENLELELDLSNANFDWSYSEAILSMIVQPPGEDPTEDMSVLVTFME